MGGLVEISSRRMERTRRLYTTLWLVAVLATKLGKRERERDDEREREMQATKEST
jgi:hypothetical protein